MGKILKYAKEYAGLLALVGVAMVYFMSRNDNPKIGFVRSEELIYGYDGMKEAQEAFASKQLGRKSSLDTLATDFQRKYQSAVGADGELNSNDRVALEEKQAQLVSYTQVLQADSKKEEDEMLGSVLTQINEFVKHYAEENGYDLILGTTADGNVLYGTPGNDLTQDILKALNEDYHGK